LATRAILGNPSKPFQTGQGQQTGANSFAMCGFWFGSICMCTCSCACPAHVCAHALPMLRRVHLGTINCCSLQGEGPRLRTSTNVHAASTHACTCAQCVLWLPPAAPSLTGTALAQHWGRLQTGWLCGAPASRRWERDSVFFLGGRPGRSFFS
jgi:hypothetical protein